jgi:DNA-binding transcriptional LysR family regulator
VLPGIDLLQLFVEVVDAGSIAAAARRLDLSASVASRKIAALEQELGTRLLIRTTRKSSLTEGGAAVLAWARETVDGYRGLNDELGALQNSPKGTIRFACNDYAAIEYLPPLLQAFCSQYPGVRLSITTTPRPEQLLETACDLVLHIGQRPDVNVVARQVGRYRRCLCAAPEYLAKFGVPHSVADLSRHRLLSHSGGESREWCFSIAGKLIRQPIDPYIEVDSYSALYSLSAAGLGIGRLSESLLAAELASGRMLKLLPQARCVFADGSIAGMWLLFPERRTLHRTRLLADFLAKAITTGFIRDFRFKPARPPEVAPSRSRPRRRR